MTGWYPYPFLDPDGGMVGISNYVVGLTLFFVILCQLLAWISRVRANKYTLY